MDNERRDEMMEAARKYVKRHVGELPLQVRFNITTAEIEEAASFCTGFADEQTRELQAQLAAEVETSEKLRYALADAIRCPMGVVPNSADGLITQEQMLAAENRRIEGKRNQ